MADDKRLTRAAEKVAAATPKTPSALTALFKSVLLPILPALIATVLVKANAKTKAILRQVRDTLNAAEIEEE